MTTRHQLRRGFVAGALLAGAMAIQSPAGAAPPRTTTTTNYKATSLAQYQEMWANPYGPGELAAGGTLAVDRSGAVTVDARPFRTGYDQSVFDHLKYIGISTRSFDVPTTGSLEFSASIAASTPGTEEGRVVHGCYGPSWSYPSLDAPCAEPWEQSVRQGQQAGVVLNMINFQTGQLFDWFVSGDRAFALIERLPTSVTGSPGTGLDLAYTQIVAETPIEPGQRHTVSIRYTRGPGTSRVEYLLDGNLFTVVDDVGVPLDVQGVPYTGYAPALGAGEVLSLDSFVIGHGLFSLLDAFPYQDPERPDLSVSIPVSERIFGQGARGTFSAIRVTSRQG